jgi:hypothetical protein
MKKFSMLLTAAVTACLLPAAPSFAREAPSGPGMMRCSVVLNRLASADAADRMPVLTWAQGYLSGMAAVASAFDGTSDVQVPAYDELQPRIAALCKADPSTDLFHVARRLSARRAHAG